MAAPDWFNENRNRTYPFVTSTIGAATIDPTSIRKLPTEAIVDAGFLPGTLSGFVAGVNSVWLNAVRRVGTTLLFEFASDAPGLYGTLLTFTRDAADGEYLTEHVETGPAADSQSDSVSEPEDECAEPAWSGFLVTGRLASLLALLPDGEILKREDGEAVVEPALIQNLSGTRMTSLNLANDDRTRVGDLPDCPEPTWPFTPEPIYVSATCLTGRIAIKPGFNMTARQNLLENRITLTPAVGRGEGQPCDEVELFPGEPPAVGSLMLGGGPACNETLRSINGLGGRRVELIAGTGIAISAQPETNTVLVDVNFVGLSVCRTDSISDISEEV